MSGSANRTSEALERRLRKLLPARIPKEMELRLESMAQAVRTKIAVDDQIRSHFAALRALFLQEGTLCAAHREIGAELGRADGQPVRRMLDQECRTAKKKGSPESSDNNPAGGELLAPGEPAAATAPSRTGRKVTWAQDRLPEKEFIDRAVEEASMYLPAAGGQPHPQAADLVRRLAKELRLTPESIADWHPTRDFPQRPQSRNSHLRP